MIKNYLLVTLFVTFYCNLYAQDFSNRGKEFWIAYPAHIDGTGSVMGVYITSDVNASGTLKAGATTLNFTVTANQVTKLFLGPNGGGDASNIPVYLNQHHTVIPAAGIEVKSDKDIIVYAHIIRSARSGATLVLPTKVWGREYVVPSFRNAGNGGAAAGYGEIAVMASLPNTTIEITPSINGRGGTPVAGTPYQITLTNPGDVYFYQGTQHSDISGTLVKSVRNGNEPCKPIAVFSATTWSALDCVGSSGGDNLLQQLFPAGAWGKTFVTAPFINRPYDVIRVYTRNAGVTVTKTENGITTTLNNYNATGRYYEFSTNQPTFIDASEPVQVAQFIVSQTCGGGQADPEMIMLNPIDQTLNNITVFSAHENYVPVNQTQVKTHYLNIIIPTSKASSLKIDNGPPLGTILPIPGTNYSYVQADVSASSLTNPVHNIYADTGFIAIAYGFGNVESYGYNAGTNVIDRYQYVTLKNEFATVNFPATCKGTPFNFSMTFPYQPTEISWKFNGLFTDTTIKGPVADSTWNANGKQLYRYDLPGTYSIATVGTYPIKVVAQNPTPDGCEGEQEINYEIQVFEKPVSSFQITTNGCLATPVSFKNTTGTNNRPVIKYFWDFGDNNTSTTKEPQHSYNQSGNYNIKHTMITDVGCIADTSVQVLAITDPPVASFKTGSTTCVSKPIDFIDESTSASGVIVKWTWDFGDGSPVVVATNNNVRQHTYKNTGSYTVKLFVETGSGCKSEVIQKVITVNPNPVAAFDFGNACLPNASMQFTDKSAISAGDPSQFTYAWDFGNGQSSVLPNPQTTYTAPGPYQVKLIVTSGDGCIDDTTRSVTTIYQQPVAAFDFQPEICLDNDLSLNNTSSAPGSQVTAWNWDFGNNTSSNLQQPVAKYNAPGTYVISLVVTSAIGCKSETTSKQVLVNPLPQADFNLVAPYCVNTDIIVKDAAKANAGNINQWNWNLGDGTTRTLTNNADFTHRYTNTGNYNVSLQVSTDKGCQSAPMQKAVAITSFPEVKFALPESCINDPFSQFIDSTTIMVGDPAGFIYLWNFGDANANAGNPNTSTLKDPRHSYTATGNYNVSLTVTSAEGCISSANSVFTINGALPKAAFTVTGGNTLCSNENITITNNSNVDFGKISRIEIYWDYANDPSLKLLDTDPQPGKQYTYSYQPFALPATKNYTIRMVSYSGINCLSTKDEIVTVKARPDVTVTPVPPVCVDAPVLNIAGSEVNNMSGSGTFTGPGIAGTGAFTPSQAGIGDHIVRYTFTGDNGCINYSELPVKVNPVPQANAGPDRFVLEGGITTLNGASNNNANSFTWSPANYLDNINIPAPQSKPAADILYTLTVTNSEGCSATDDVFVKVLLAPIVPNVFTPNGDGINDTWKIPALESYPGNTVEVYNRYGQVIFSSRGYSIPWDGTYKDKAVPSGTYYYIIDPKNGRSPIKGFVDVVR